MCERINLGALRLRDWAFQWNEVELIYCARRTQVSDRIFYYLHRRARAVNLGTILFERRSILVPDAAWNRLMDALRTHEPAIRALAAHAAALRTEPELPPTPAAYRGLDSVSRELLLDVDFGMRRELGLYRALRGPDGALCFDEEKVRRVVDRAVELAHWLDLDAPAQAFLRERRCFLHMYISETKEP